MLGKIFKAYDVRALYPDPLNEEAGWKVGYATGMFLKQQNGQGTVVVSRDHRPAAPSMAKQLTEGLRAAGMDVVDLGRCDTSIQYFAIPHLDAVGGIQCTASHNPIEYIGYKISPRKGQTRRGRHRPQGDRGDRPLPRRHRRQRRRAGLPTKKPTSGTPTASTSSASWVSSSAR